MWNIHLFLFYIVSVAIFIFAFFCLLSNITVSRLPSFLKYSIRISKYNFLWRDWNCHGDAKKTSWLANNVVTFWTRRKVNFGIFGFSSLYLSLSLFLIYSHALFVKLKECFFLFLKLDHLKSLCLCSYVTLAHVLSHISGLQMKKK